jgi:hypothetical protein
MIPIPKKPEPTPVNVEAVLLHGDLSKLTEEQRLDYYNSVCKSLGLNPLTRPFEYLWLNGQLQLYARKACTDQLRKINEISVEIISQEFAHDLLTIHVKAKDKTGRLDEDAGVVAFPKTLRGEVAANAIMKAITKAKRRVTLSISGLGFLDETEVEDIPAPAKAEPAKAEPPPLPDYSDYVIQLQSRSHDGWREFAANLLTAIREDGQIAPWRHANSATLALMQNEVPKMHANLMKSIQESVEVVDVVDQ